MPASTPSLPSVIATSAGPRSSQSSRISSGVRARGEPGEVLGADLHDVGDRQQLVHAVEYVGGVAHEQRTAVGVVADRGGGGGLGHQLPQHGGAGRRGERQRPGVQADDRAVQRALQLLGAPLPVGRARDPEVVARHTVGTELDHRHRRLLGGRRDVAEVDVVGRQVLAQATAEQVVREAGEHPRGHAEPGEPHGDVRRAAPGTGFEVLRHRRRDEVDQRLACHGDDALTAGAMTAGALTAGLLPRAAKPNAAVDVPFISHVGRLPPRDGAPRARRTYRVGTRCRAPDRRAIVRAPRIPPGPGTGCEVPR